SAKSAPFVDSFRSFRIGSCPLMSSKAAPLQVNSQAETPHFKPEHSALAPSALTRQTGFGNVSAPGARLPSMLCLDPGLGPPCGRRGNAPQQRGGPQTDERLDSRNR